MTFLTNEIQALQHRWKKCVDHLVCYVELLRKKVSVNRHMKAVSLLLSLLFLLLHQHAKLVSLLLSFLLLLCHHRHLCLILVAAFFTSLKSSCSFLNILPKQKFVISCWVENLLMKNTGYLHVWISALLSHRYNQVFILAILFCIDNIPSIVYLTDKDRYSH